MKTSLSTWVSRAGLELLPKRGLSETMYWLARRHLPRATRTALYKAYADLYHVDLDEMEGTLADFPTLDAFFTRALKQGARVIDAAPRMLVAPCDGARAAYGDVSELRLTQIKGRTYSLAELLDSEGDAACYAGGRFVTIYLSPRNYHRVHAPVEARLRRVVHLPGRLYPVNALAVRSVPELFARNERLVFHFDTEFGPLALVMVAATCVSTITLSVGPDGADFKRGLREERRYANPIEVARGQELGAFHLGSTVVAVVPERVEWAPAEIGTAVRLGERLGQWRV